MKRVYRAVAAAALMSASGAWAVKVGDNLFIKAKGVKLLKEPKATSAAAAPKELAVGDTVVWKGASDKDKTFHQIEVGGKTGFVLMSALSPSKPQQEIVEGGKALDTKAFASSGAATKGLTQAALSYSANKSKAGDDTMKKAAVQVIYAEEHSKNKGTPEAIEAKAKSLLGGGK